MGDNGCITGLDVPFVASWQPCMATSANGTIMFRANKISCKFPIRGPFRTLAGHQVEYRHGLGGTCGWRWQLASRSRLVAWVGACGYAVSPGRVGGTRRHTQQRAAGRCRVPHVAVCVGNHRPLVAHALTGKWNLRGLPRPRLLRRRGVGLQRDRPARRRPQGAVDVHTPRRDSGDAVYPVTVGDVLHGQRRDRLSVGLLRGANRPLAEPLLAAAVRHPHLPPGLRYAGPAGPP